MTSAQHGTTNPAATLTGHLGAGAGPALDQVSLADEREPLVDLRGVSSVDALGVEALARCAARLGKHGKALRLDVPTRFLDDLRRLGLGDLLTVRRVQPGAT